MLGCHDFCGYYEWTFHYLRRKFGEHALNKYWSMAIGHDSQQHYIDAAKSKGMLGLYQAWSKTGVDEGCDWTVALDSTGRFLSLDMRACPSKGFLVQHDLNQDEDYCDHCIGWISVALDSVGAEVIAHEHNHCGQCWWQMGEKRPVAESNVSQLPILNDPRWQYGYLHRFEQNRLVAPSSDYVSYAAELILAAFAGFEGIQLWGENFEPDQKSTPSVGRLAAIATDSTYLLLSGTKLMPRAVILGHDEMDWRQIAAQWNDTDSALRPLLLHPYLPAAKWINFPEFGLPRPLPLLPLLIRTGVYSHRPVSPVPTAHQWAIALKLALEASAAKQSS
jgi:hypothetical protein